MASQNLRGANTPVTVRGERLYILLAPRWKDELAVYMEKVAEADTTNCQGRPPKTSAKTIPAFRGNLTAPPSECLALAPLASETQSPCSRQWYCGKKWTENNKNSQHRSLEIILSYIDLWNVKCWIACSGCSPKEKKGKHIKKLPFLISSGHAPWNLWPISLAKTCIRSAPYGCEPVEVQRWDVLCGERSRQPWAWKSKTTRPLRLHCSAHKNHSQNGRFGSFNRNLLDICWFKAGALVAGLDTKRCQLCLPSARIWKRCWRHLPWLPAWVWPVVLRKVSTAAAKVSWSKNMKKHCQPQKLSCISCGLPRNS